MVEFLLGFYLGGLALQMFRISQAPDVSLAVAALVGACWPWHVYCWVRDN